MDALNGYGSSSSSDEDNSKQPEEKLRKRQADADFHGATTTIKNPPAVAAAMASLKKPPDVRRGKKILSLASVLPRHILDRWTNADWDDDDDSDDDRQQKPSRQSIQKNENITSATALPPRTNPKSTEIAALLRDLQKVTPLDGGTAAGAAVLGQRSKAAAAPESTSSGDRMGGDSNKNHAEPLGSAFITSVVITTNKASTTTDAVVRDIHGGEQSYDPHSNPLALDDDYPTDAPPLPQASQLSFFGVDSSDNRPRKPASRIINAAPRILHPPNSSAGAMPPTASGEPSPPSSPQHPPTEEEDRGIAGPSRSKRSRQEMERALRQGRVAQVMDEQAWRLTHHVESVDPTAYTPPVPAVATTTTKLRNVPLPRYDPALGNTTTTIGTGGGHRNNPIQQLLSQAVQLEQQRLQQSSTGTTNVKLHRANAKRKYGW